MKVVTEYSKGKKIMGDIYEGKLKCHNKFIEVSIRVCSSVQTAYRYFSDLQKFNGSPNVATAYSFSETEDGKGLTFTEPLKKIDGWLDDNGKNMWRSNRQGDKILGFGQEAQDFFYKTGLGMEAINLVGVVHGNLVKYNKKDVIGTEGVMFGSDGNPRVCNFQYDEPYERPEMIRRLQKDLNDFESLIILARRKHPPRLPFAGDSMNEYKLFFDLFKVNKYRHVEPRKFVEDKSMWIYRASAFWNKTKVSLFFDMFNQLLDSNSGKLQELAFLEEFKDWMKTINIHGQSEMQDCLNYKSRARGNLPYLYSASPSGIIRFMRNYKAHRNQNYNIRDSRYYSVERALEEVLELFPGLLGCTYNDLFSSLKNTHISRNNGPVEYRGMRYDEYFCKHPSIFELDKP